MKSFKGYLSEEDKTLIKWQQSASTKLFDVASASSMGFDAFWMPMSPSVMKRLWPTELRATVFHVTDEAGYRTVKKLQGKKKSISTFFEMRSNYFEQGVGTTGGVVLELDANVLGAFNQDVMSAPDKAGRRWIQLYYWKGRFGEKDLSKYSKGIQDLIGNLLNKYWKKIMNVSSIPRFQKGRYYIHWMNLGQSARSDKKTLSLIIKDYMDGIEKIYKQNATHLRGILTNYLNLRRTEEAWDEIIANNFKIKKVMIASYSSSWGDPHATFAADLAKMVGDDPVDPEYEEPMNAFMKEVKDDGFPVEKTTGMDLEMYTRKIARAESGEKRPDQTMADDEFARRQAEVLRALGKR